MDNDAAELDAIKPGHIGNRIAVGGLRSHSIDTVQAEFVRERLRDGDIGGAGINHHGSLDPINECLGTIVAAQVALQYNLAGLGQGFGSIGVHLGVHEIEQRASQAQPESNNKYRF